MKKDPENAFDVIVVGSGIGGLAAGSLLAASGSSVLVLEQHDRPGGYAHGFRRKRYHFDSSVHLISGCEADGFPGGQIIHKTLHAIGVRETIDFLPIDPVAVAIYPQLRARIPRTKAAFLHEMAALFPEETQGLENLIDLSFNLAVTASNAQDIVNNDPDPMQSGLSSLQQYRKSSLGDLCSQFVRDPGLIAILGANWPYLGLPPSRVSFLYWAMMFIGYLEDGACYCRGSFQRLADRLVDGLLEHGGKIRLRSAVRRICVERNEVTGVELRDGEVLKASNVIANSDMRQTVFDLVGNAHFPARFLNRLESLKPSLSIFVVYLATDLGPEGLGLGHESFYYSDMDHDRNYQDSCQGRINWIGISIPTLSDPALAPKGRHLAMLTTLLPYAVEGDWKKAKAGYIDAMLALAEKVWPGLNQHLLYVEGGSPNTLERYTWNYQGAAYGWDLRADQTGARRIQNRSPIRGLYFAGHWATPGGGVCGAAVSGMQTAKSLLGIRTQSEFWERFRTQSAQR